MQRRIVVVDNDLRVRGHTPAPRQRLERIGLHHELAVVVALEIGVRHADRASQVRAAVGQHLAGVDEHQLRIAEVVFHPVGGDEQRVRRGGVVRFYVGHARSSIQPSISGNSSPSASISASGVTS